MEISVVMPVWNTGENAAKLIKKLLAQSEDLEVVAVDDGSTDDSLRRLKEAAKEAGPGRVRVMTQKNAGASAARNTGMEVARGKYVMFLDSDDDVMPGFVASLVKKLENRGTLLAGTGVKYRKLQYGTEEDVYLAPRRRQRKKERLADYVLYLLLLDGRLYGVINKMFRAEVIRKNKIKFEEGRTFAEDTNFVLEYLKWASREQRDYSSGDINDKRDYTPGDIKDEDGYSSGDIIYRAGEIAFVPKALYVYNSGTETSTVKTSATKWANWAQSYRDLKNWAREVEGGQIGWKTRALLAAVRLRWVVSYWRAKRRAKR